MSGRTFLLHAWDFAQASGQKLQVSDEVTPPSDATPLQRLVAFSGRTPVTS
jgi:hypothetical protein